MAMYRNVRLSFWSDSKVEEEFTPEDKYFYLYLLTNPQTNISGCYKVSYGTMVKDTGYSKDTIIRLIKRFDEVHDVLKFDEATGEILLLNWHKYNWTSSEKILTGIKTIANKIASENFKDYIFRQIECYKNDQQPCKYVRQDVTEESTNIEEFTDDDEKNNSQIVKDVIDYLNIAAATNYKSTSEKTKRLIKTRIKDGFALDDFKTVIDKKTSEWRGTDMEKFLRPETLFGNKFESYLNQKIITRNTYINTINTQANQLNVFLKKARGDEVNDRGRNG